MATAVLLDDSEFQVGAGANGSVESVEVQSDGKILVAGGFTTFNGAERNGLVRLNSNGSVDTSYNAGLNGSASDVDVQADGKILVAGNFTAASGLRTTVVAAERTFSRMI